MYTLGVKSEQLEEWLIINNSLRVVFRLWITWCQIKASWWGADCNTIWTWVTGAFGLLPLVV